MRIYLPAGDWYDLYNDKKYASGIHVVETPLERLPVFVKSGAVIPMQSLVQSLQEKPEETLDLHVYNGEGEFNFYEDDGLSYDFENGKYSQRQISVKQNKITITKSGGEFSSPFKRMKIYLHGFNELENVEVNGKKIAVTKSSYRFMNPISNFDPFYSDKDSIGSCDVFVTE
jgi:alpha-glucosidase